MLPHVLILGGTTESRLLAERLQARGDVRITLSLAGTTQTPLVQPVPTRVGGFGGVEGLSRYLRDERVACLVDASHPFAYQMSANATKAARDTQTPLVIVLRPGWVRQPGDRWTEVRDIESAIEALGERPRRVFVTTGRRRLAALQKAPQHHYWIRTVDKVNPPLPVPHAHYIVDTGPFTEESEQAILTANAIEVVVAKDSGGQATYAKIVAARKRGLPVILIQRGEASAHGAVGDVDSAEHHVVSALGLGMERGV